jgi:hypothetical protein
VASHSFWRQSTFFLQLVPLLENSVSGFEDGFGLCVVQPDLTARLGCNLGDTAPHGACANDGDFFECESHVWEMGQKILAKSNLAMARIDFRSGDEKSAKVNYEAGFSDALAVRPG